MKNFKKSKWPKFIHENQIGQAQVFEGPFGLKPILYCDYIASGRSLKFIEEKIINEILPWYANTHTTSTITGTYCSENRKSLLRRDTFLRKTYSN